MADKEQRSVLGGLPSSRPQRIGAPRTTARATTTGTRGATAKASVQTRSVKRAAPKRKPPKPAAPSGAEHHGPQAVRSASPPLKTHRAADAPPPRPIGAPKGTELVTTTIRAAGELTQIGFTVTGRILKRAVDRIPRP